MEVLLLENAVKEKSLELGGLHSIINGNMHEDKTFFWASHRGTNFGPKFDIALEKVFYISFAPCRSKTKRNEVKVQHNPCHFISVVNISGGFEAISIPSCAQK